MLRKTLTLPHLSNIPSSSSNYPGKKALFSGDDTRFEILDRLLLIHDWGWIALVHKNACFYLSCTAPPSSAFSNKPDEDHMDLSRLLLLCSVEEV